MALTRKYQRTELKWERYPEGSPSGSSHWLTWAEVNDHGDKYQVEHVDVNEKGFGQEGWLLTYPSGDIGGFFPTGVLKNPMESAKIAAEAHHRAIMSRQAKA